MGGLLVIWVTKQCQSSIQERKQITEPEPCKSRHLALPPDRLSGVPGRGGEKTQGGGQLLTNDQ